MNEDAMSLSMFWAGLLMVFAPMIFAGIVVSVWWFQRRKAARIGNGEAQMGNGDGNRE